MTARLWTFDGCGFGPFQVLEMKAVIGAPLPAVSHLRVTDGPIQAPPADVVFRLQGVVSNERYVTSAEKTQLLAQQAPIGRDTATYGALIPIRKAAAWWALAQDERRAVFEERSRHVALGLAALPAVARRLHHCRDLGADAAFDFLTWFDFAPEQTAAFDDLLGALRTTEEWQYVEREVEVRVVRAANALQLMA